MGPRVQCILVSTDVISRKIDAQEFVGVQAFPDDVDIGKVLN